uniref:Elongator complex protein 5 n=1 Tax=Leptobrachium leishanense TaxID=445787 RepID=A0A8C5LP83_9ANUR
MLQELRTTGSPGITIISDSVLLPGRDLLLSFILASLQRGEQLHVIAFDVSREDFFAGFPGEFASRVTFHDGFSDPLGWESDPSAFTRDDFTVTSIMKRVGRPELPVTIVLDSLSWILARIPLTSVCHTLLGLTAAPHEGCGKLRMLALLHGDLHSPALLGSLSTVVDTFLDVRGSGEHLHVCVRHRRKTGKVISSGEELRILDTFALDIMMHRDSATRKENEVDPTKDLTFNLRLSDTERERKESAALPYVFSSNKKSSLLSSSSSSSAKIYYDPDPADDVDDEDPDDDLDV